MKKMPRRILGLVGLLCLLFPALPVGAGWGSPASLSPLPPLPSPTSWEGGEGVPPPRSAERAAAGVREEGLLSAAGRGRPWINLLDGAAVPTTYTGAAGLVQALDTAQPRALAADDFDEDGMPDLVAGYAAGDEGLVALHFGSLDYLWPDGPEADARRAAGLFVDAPFLPDARLFALPIVPDFLGAGDFDNDGHRDVVAAARGGTTLYLLSGDGQGGFGAPEAIPLPGAVTALAAGEVNRRDGLPDLVVGIVGARHAVPLLLVFEGPTGALRWAPETIPLPAPATSLAIGQLDDHYCMDIAAACGETLVLVHGRDRMLSVLPPPPRSGGGGQGGGGQSPTPPRTPTPPPAPPPPSARGGVWAGGATAPPQSPTPALTTHALPYPLLALALGDFVPGEAYTKELALLAADGVIHFVAPTTASELAQFSLLEPATCNLEPPTCNLQPVTCNLSALPGDDLAVLDPANNQVHLVVAVERGANWDESGVWETVVRPGSVALGTAGAPAALLPMRLNPDALSDLVVLQAGRSAPVVAATAPLTSFTVNSTGDESDSYLQDDICDICHNPIISPTIPPCGICTLRAAVQQANATPGGDEIHFLLGGGTPSIPIDDSMGIESSVTILGNTGGATRVQLTPGAGFGNDHDVGLALSAPDSVVRGLVFYGFCTGLYLNSFGGSFVEGNYIGPDPSGTMVPPLDCSGTYYGYGVGVRLNSGYGYTIGGTTAEARNVISGHTGWGIYGLNATTVWDSVIQGNYFGTDASGKIDLGNGYNGIDVILTNCTVGGTTAQARNVASGNGRFGLAIRRDGNLVQGNYLGTDASGTMPLGNGTGIDLRDAVGNTIGGPATGAANVMAYNSQRGVVMYVATRHDTSNNRVSRNIIHDNGVLGIDLFGGGIDPPGGGVTPNDHCDGDGGANHWQNYPVLITTTLSGGQVTIEGFLDSTPSTTFALEFFGSSACSPSGYGEGQFFLGEATVTTGPDCLGHFVVTLPVRGESFAATATDPAGNTSEFSACALMFVEAITVNSTGDLPDVEPADDLCWTGLQLPDGRPECTLRAAIQTTNAGSGQAIVFDLPGAEVPTIQPVGPLPAVTRTVLIDGTTAEAGGVELDGSQAGAGADGLALRADYCTVQGFIINRFSGNGVSIVGQDHSTVRRNWIGTDRSGSVGQGNGGAGVRIVDASSNTVGGTEEVYRNVIAGNAGSGVEILYQSRATIWNQVQGNYIGMGADGMTAVGNGADGVLISGAFSNTVGGTTGTAPSWACTGACNLISGNGVNDGHGVHIVGAGADWNVVQGNFIGVNDNGIARRPNRGHGVLMENAPRNLVGGTNEAARNVIAGNGSSGVAIVGSAAAGNKVQGNSVGVGPRGENLYNGVVGVLVQEASGCAIGGTEPGAGNTIAYNKSGGVIVLVGHANAILGNSIHDNGGLGIDLSGDGWTPNDDGDGDDGGNGRQNFPALQYITVTGGTTTFSGTLQSQPDQTYRVEFFGSATCPGSGLIQGQSYLGAADVTTDGSGRGAFRVTFPGAWPIATATATDASDNTSEFAPPDIRITGVEVTQAIQNLANEVTLIAGKSTLARVFVRTQSCDLAGVTAELSLDGVDPQPPLNGPLTARAQPLERPSADERKELKHSLNFSVPAEWLDEGGALLLTVEVNPGCERPDADCQGANQRTILVYVGEEQPLKVVFWHVYWRAYPLGPVHSANDDPHFSPVLLKDLIQEMYPVPAVEPMYLDWPDVLLTNWPEPTAAHYAYMVGKLEKKAKVGWALGSWPRDAVHYGYWGEADGGLGNPWGVAATGGTGVSKGVWVASHEIGHTLGSWHVDCAPEGAGFCDEKAPFETYPYPEGRISLTTDPHHVGTFYGYDPARFSRAEVVPPQAYDNMSYGLPRWMSDYSWDQFRWNRELRRQIEEERSRTYGPGEYVLLSGVMTPTLGTAQLEPFYRLADVPTATLPISGAYAVELWGGDALLAAYPFTLTPGLHPPEEGEPFAHFVLLAPYVSGTTHLDLVSGTVALVSRTVSAQAPAVTITYPLGGEVFSETLTVSWAASDADGDTLAYALLYSRDDGQTWLPLVLDWPTATFALSTTMLAGSDQARVQVWATDGVNTGVDVTEAFTVPTRGPSLVTIVFPEDGGRYPADRLTLLRGGAWDPEDGALTGEALVWTDSIDGLLGTGEGVWAALSIGRHTLTLTATDSAGKSAAASVSFYVGHQVYLPLVQR